MTPPVELPPVTSMPGRRVEQLSITRADRDARGDYGAWMYAMQRALKAYELALYQPRSADDVIHIAIAVERAEP